MKIRYELEVETKVELNAPDKDEAWRDRLRKWVKEELRSVVRKEIMRSVQGGFRKSVGLCNEEIKSD